MPSHSVYFLTGFTIPFAILNAFYFFSLVAVVHLIATSMSANAGQIRLPRLIRLALESMFVGLETKTKTDTEMATKTDTETATKTKDGPRYFEVCMHGKTLSRKSVFAFVLLVLTVFGCSVATLWSVMVIRESTICGEEGYDCFINGEKVTDCNIFENGTTVSINGTDHYLECYRFVFDYVGGLTAAGGVTFFARVVINTLVFTVVWIGEVKNSCWRLLAQAVSFILLCVTMIGFSTLNALQLTNHISIPTLFTFLVYGITFACSVVVYLGLEIEFSNPNNIGYAPL